MSDIKPLSDEKRCSRCLNFKKLSDYAKARGQCRKCRAEIDSARNQIPEVKRRNAVICLGYTNRNREKRRLYARTHRRKPERAARDLEIRDKSKAKCRQTLRNAVACGKVKKPNNCSACGFIGKIQGHHPDYSKPLEVVWLCSICHVSQHKKYKNV